MAPCGEPQHTDWRPTHTHSPPILEAIRTWKKVQYIFNPHCTARTPVQRRESSLARLQGTSSAPCPLHTRPNKIRSYKLEATCKKCVKIRQRKNPTLAARMHACPCAGGLCWRTHGQVACNKCNKIRLKNKSKIHTARMHTRAQAGFVANASTEHESRIDANLLVTSVLFAAAARLPRLAALTVRGRSSVHVHDLALRQLSGCGSLQVLDVEAPSEWPFLTRAGLSAAPRGLRRLLLGCQTPATLVREAAAADLAGVDMHMQVRGQHAHGNAEEGKEG
eukprot:356472-Chlamydomonas_euryale.AAC.5